MSAVNRNTGADAFSLIAFLCGLAAANPARAVPLVDVFKLPVGNNRPVGVAIASDDSVWFTDPGTDAVGRIGPAGGLTLLALPPPSGPAGIVSDGDGGVWFTQNDRGAIGRFPVEPPHVLEEFFVPTAGAQPFAIAVGPEGNIWFTDIGANQIGRLAPDATITEFQIPTDLAVPAGITVTSDGAVWFTEFNRNQIGRLNPDGSFTEIALNTPGSGPFGIVADPADTVFFTQLNGNRIGRIAPDGFYAEFHVPTEASQPAGITTGRGGDAWFTQINADQIAVLVGDLVFEFDVPPGSFEAGTLFGGGITSGPGSQLSFAASAAAAIDRVETCVTSADCPTGNCEFLLCAPPLPTPTAVSSRICQDDDSCPSGFFCNIAEGRLCCEMTQCPPGFTCRFPGREGFCTALPTATPSPTASVEATATWSPTSIPTVTRAPEVSPTPPQTHTATPSPTEAGGSNGGCTIVDPAGPHWAWLWLLLPIVVLAAAHPRSWRTFTRSALGILLFAFTALSSTRVSAGEPPVPTPTLEDTASPTPTASASATVTPAATATPHLVELRVGSTVSGPGDAAYVEISVSVTNAVPAAVVHELTFPSDVLELHPANCFLSPSIPKTLRADVVSETEDQATVRIVVESSRNLDPLRDGLLFTCSFSVSPLALPGSHDISSGLTAAYAANGSEIKNVRGTSGRVTISFIGEPCTGDCDAGGSVTVDEILTGVGIALGLQPMGACPRFDADVSGGITVDELVTTVINALNGCNLPPPPLPTATPTATPRRTAIFVRLNGNDANSGLTPARALRTISQAARIAPSGYRIVVGPGVYVEGITTDGFGRAPENLVFEADAGGVQTGDPQGPVIIDASESVIAAGFRLTKAVGSVIDGFTIIGGTDAGIVLKSESSGFVIRNCVVFNNPGAGIRVQDSDDVLVFNNLVYGNGREGIAIVGQGSGSANARVINNTVFGNSDRALRVGTTQKASPGALVRNNVFQSNGIGFAPLLENIKIFPSSELGYDGDFNLVFPPTYLPFDLVGDADIGDDAAFLGADEDDFRLSFASPAVDAGGVLPQDLESQLRPRSATGAGLDEGRIDLGYHFPP